MSLVLQRGVPGACFFFLFFLGMMVIGWLLERKTKKKKFFSKQVSIKNSIFVWKYIESFLKNKKKFGHDPWVDVSLDAWSIQAGLTPALNPFPRPVLPPKGSCCGQGPPRLNFRSNETQWRWQINCHRKIIPSCSWSEVKVARSCLSTFESVSYRNYGQAVSNQFCGNILLSKLFFSEVLKP